MTHRLGLALICALLLSACGNDIEPTSNGALLKSLSSSGMARIRGGSAPEPMTRARLAEVVTPVMLMTIERTGVEALFAEIETSRGVETWSSVDDITISLRNGVIVATRGFGADLMAANVPAVSLASGGGQGHTRQHSTLNGEDQPVQTDFTCRFSQDGVKAVDIVQISYSLTHVVETCAAGDLSFQNDFWLGSDQKIRKSRQWISPEVGFITIEDVGR
jgi:hypothetical protein